MYKFLPPQPPDALVLNVIGNVTFNFDGANTNPNWNDWLLLSYLVLMPTKSLGFLEKNISLCESSETTSLSVLPLSEPINKFYVHAV